MSKRRLILMILSLVWMVVIFCFSARDADESEEDSYKVGLTVGKIVVPDFEDKSETEQLEFAQKIDHPVRKAAHATEYAVLAMLLVGAFYPLGKLGLVLPFIISAVYATTDEIHQLFVSGRDGNVTDVMIDSSGALLGVLVLFMIISLKKRKSHKSCEI